MFQLHKSAFREFKVLTFKKSEISFNLLMWCITWEEDFTGWIGETEAEEGRQNGHAGISAPISLTRLPQQGPQLSTSANL